MGVAGATTLGPQWTEITPPQALVSKQSIQELRLAFPAGHEVDVQSGGSDFAKNSVRFVNGKQIVFEGAVFDVQGTAYELALSGIDGSVLLSNKGPLSFPSQGPLFPQDRVYPKLRLRASESVPLSSIRWECRTPE